MGEKERIQNKLKEDLEFLEDGILKVYQNQTSDEQRSHSTNKLNGMGFNGTDAEFGSSLAEWILKGREKFGRKKGASLTVGQVVRGRKMMMKYWRQV